MRSVAWVVLVACLVSQTVWSTEIEQRALPDIVKDADHVFVATIIKIDMVDGEGKNVADERARTGPDLENQIRFHLTVKESLYTTSEPSRTYVIVRLWQWWHYTLGQFQKETGQTYIFLLKGDTYDPAYPADFQRPLAERPQIEALLRSQGRI
jgi:hypothetical protein